MQGRQLAFRLFGLVVFALWQDHDLTSDRQGIEQEREPWLAVPVRKCCTDLGEDVGAAVTFAHCVSNHVGLRRHYTLQCLSCFALGILPLLFWYWTNSEYFK